MAIGASPTSDVATVKTVRAELGVGFFEMPLPPEHIDGYAKLSRRLDIPLALDSLMNRHRALQFLQAEALHVLQPDVCRAGGITETMRVAQLADAFGAQATPHVSIGSPQDDPQSRE